MEWHHPMGVVRGGQGRELYRKTLLQGGENLKPT